MLSLLLVTVMLAFAACSGSDSEEPPHHDEPSEESSSETQEKNESESTSQSVSESEESSSNEESSSEGCSHALEYNSARAPSCTEAGYEAYEYCLICDYTTRVDIPATGHSEVYHEARDPGCTNVGWDAYVTCENCDYSTYEEKPIVHDYQDGACTLCSKRKPSEGLSISMGTMTTPYGSGYVVTGIGSCTDTDIVIPEEYNGHAIIGIVNFTECNNITSVYIPEGVLGISEKAFEDCQNLTSINIPDSMTYIGARAFEGCQSLTTVTISENSNCTTFGEQVFSGCSSLTEIRIPDGVTTLNHAFYGCSSLKSVTFGRLSQCAEIKYSAFSNCTSLESITIPSTVKTLGGFYGCTSLKNVYFDTGSQCTTLEDAAFRNCTSLESFRIPAGAIYYGMQVFAGCSSLKSVTIPDTAHAISQSMFASCSSLEEVILPDALITIDKSAFSGCSSLKSITIPVSVQVINQSAFANCSSLESIVLPFIGATAEDDGITTNDNLGFIFGYLSSPTSPADYGNFVPESLKTVTFNATTITEEMFAGCKDIETVIIYGNPDKIEDRAFAGCSSLKNIEIPESCKSIGEYAFANCTSLATISVPTSVETIGSAAFSGCSSLRTMILPFVGGSVHATVADETTLFGYIFGTEQYDGGQIVYQLKGEQYDGENFVSIQYCIPQSLKNVSILGGNVLFGAFENCRMIEYVSLPVDIEQIEARMFCGCSSLKDVTFPYAIKFIGNMAFSYTDIETIHIPASVEFIDKYAFNACTSLASFEVDENNEFYCSIDGNLYSKNGKILYYYAAAKSDTDFIVPDGVEIIEEYAISHCTNLQHVTLCEGITQIMAGVFDQSYNIKSIVIPKTVTVIVASAFSELHYNFETFYFTGSEQEWAAITVTEYPYFNLSDYEVVYNYVVE